MVVKLNGYAFKKSMFLKGYNLSELSKITGVGISYLSQIINNKKAPSPKLAKNIAEALDVEIEDIFEIE
ncbi:helix-turn-helix domain-containing protein [Staphylococcus simulans]|uniref:helix-turn-helix domain-containing protein n=1 Tax=Staphylococcus simulans TaxID=1286 RepID=UPI0021CFAFCF|nr:helix-turn-helix transcriptional regulator [Staphylococcus simulans]UXR44796.1 helix-turn-helix transcriptional regulator [Staphylococcus simulans]